MYLFLLGINQQGIGNVLFDLYHFRSFNFLSQMFPGLCGPCRTQIRSASWGTYGSQRDIFGSSMFSVGNDIHRVSGPFNCFMLSVNRSELTGTQKLNHKGTKTQIATLKYANVILFA